MDVEKRREGRRTESGIEVKPLYGPDDLEGFDYPEKLGDPGEYPFTRGPYPSMYRGRPWTMRQYAGFGTARETNERFKYLTENGQTGLSVAFDLPTQMGRDSDHALALGEVGKVGVAIDSLLDMRDLFDGIPLKDVSTSMTINATASILLLLYSLVAEEQGAAPEDVTGTTQNDILKEYLARGTYIYPPEPSMRVTTDMFAYCARELPRWNTISISGYHIREAGSTAVQELAFTLSNAIAYVEAAVEAGLEVDEFAPRLSFFFNAHNDLFQEVAKYRAARRMWARIVRERFGARREEPEAALPHPDRGLLPHGPAGREQRRQDHRAGPLGRARRDPEPAHQRLRRGARPPDRAKREDCLKDAADPGERGRPHRHRRPAGRLLLRRVAHRRRRGGGVGIHPPHRRNGRVGEGHRGALYAARDRGRSLPLPARGREGGARSSSASTATLAEPKKTPTWSCTPSDESILERQTERLAQLKEDRDNAAVEKALADLKAAAEGSDNLLYPMREALENLATVGEVSDTLREVFGQYRPS